MNLITKLYKITGRVPKISVDWNMMQTLTGNLPEYAQLGSWTQKMCWVFQCKSNVKFSIFHIKMLIHTHVVKSFGTV